MRQRRLLVGSLAVAALIGVAGGWWLSGRDNAHTDTLPAPGAGSLPASEIPVATDLSGHHLPDATARTLTGAAVPLRSLLGQPLILNFWSSTCIPCRKEMPAFESLHQAVGDRVRIVGIDPQDSPDAATEFAKKVGASYELLRDADGSVIAKLGVAALPTSIFVRADGTILRSKPGALSEAQLRSMINSLFPT